MEGSFEKRLFLIIVKSPESGKKYWRQPSGE